MLVFWAPLAQQLAYRCVTGLRCGCVAGVVDACLIPEVPFKIHGETGLLK